VHAEPKRKGKGGKLAKHACGIARKDEYSAPGFAKHHVPPSTIYQLHPWSSMVVAALEDYSSPPWVTEASTECITSFWSAATKVYPYPRIQALVAERENVHLASK